MQPRSYVVILEGPLLAPYVSFTPDEGAFVALALGLAVSWLLAPRSA